MISAGKVYISSVKRASDTCFRRLICCRLSRRASGRAFFSINSYLKLRRPILRVNKYDLWTLFKQCLVKPQVSFMIFPARGRTAIQGVFNAMSSTKIPKSARVPRGQTHLDPDAQDGIAHNVGDAQEAIVTVTSVVGIE